MSDDELLALAEAGIARFDTDGDEKLSSGEELKAWNAARVRRE